MQIKQFAGSSIEELLPQIRAELGDDAVILQTKRVVRGGLGGFFGREGIEVTAAEGPPPERSESIARERPRPGSLNLVDDDVSADRENLRAAVRDIPALDDAPPAFSRHLRASLSAAQEAVDGPAASAPGGPPRGAIQMDGPARTQALIESAREAMRDAGSRAAMEQAATSSATAGRGGARTPSSRAGRRRSPEPWSPPRIEREEISDRVEQASREPLFPELERGAAPGVPASEEREHDTGDAWFDDLLAAPTSAGVERADPAARSGAEVAEAAALVQGVATVREAGAVSAGVAATMAVLGPRGVIVDRARAPRSGRAGGELDPLEPSAGPLAALRVELVEAGVEPCHADSLTEGFRRGAWPFLPIGSDPREALERWIAARLPVVRAQAPAGPGRAIALVGQSGVGKTTVACKLAASMGRAGLRAALVLAGEGPHHAARGLAGELGLEVTEAADAGALLEARARLADRDLIVIDTPGRALRREDEVEALVDLLGGADLDEVHLVAPAGGSLDDVDGLARRFAPIGLSGLAITKLDETGVRGNLVNYPMRVGVPIAFLSDGIRIPGGLRPADGAEIAGMLLP